QFYRQFALTIAVSTLLSAFNSLTLSPALSALLLKPQHKGGVGEPLPRVSFPLLGAWLAYVYLGPWLTPWLARGVEQLPPAVAAYAPEVTEWSGLVAAAVAGVLVGWLVGRPLNRLLGWFFWAFNAAFNWSTGVYARGVGLLLRVSALVLLAYGGLLFLTYW